MVTNYLPRNILLLSVTQPGHSRDESIIALRLGYFVTSVGFATLVHTRCALIVSGATSNNREPRLCQLVKNLATLN